MSKFFIFSTAFLTGFVLMGFEILGSRVLAPYFGNSVHVWGALIAVMMVGLSIGYAAGGKIADRFDNPKILSAFILVPAFLLLIFPAYQSAVCKICSARTLDPRLGALLASGILFSIPCAFLGTCAPFLVKISVKDLNSVGNECGLINAISTIGCVTGTLTTSFFMISWISVSSGIQLLGGLLFISSGFCLAIPPNSLRKTGFLSTD